MNNIKVIDLLIMISRGEELPKKIKYNDKIYYMVGNNDYENYEYDEEPTLMYAIGNTHNMNDEVEIIEDKKIETIKSFTSNVGAVDENNVEEYIHKLFEQELILYFKINEIIDKLNKEE